MLQRCLVPLALVILTSTLTSQVAVAWDPPPMPTDGRVSQAWWNQYAAWCLRHGGTPIQDGTGGRCNGLKNSGPTTSGTSPGTQALGGAAYNLGYAFGRWLVGGDSSTNHEVRVDRDAEQREQEAARRQAQDQAERARAERQHAVLLGSLKSLGTVDSTGRAPGAAPQLALKGFGNEAGSLTLKDLAKVPMEDKERRQLEERLARRPFFAERAPGFPLVPADKLGMLEPADIKANIARMTPDELKQLDLIIQERQATLSSAIDGIKQREFSAQLGADSPADLKTWKDIARDKLTELPFADAMESLGKGESQEMDLEARYKLVTQADKAYEAGKSLAEWVDGEKYAKAKRILGVPEGVTVSTSDLTRLAAARAADPASYDRLIAKFGWEDARSLAGLALSAGRISLESGMAYKKFTEAQSWPEAATNAGPHVANALKEAMPRPGEIVKIGGWIRDNLSLTPGANTAGVAGTAARAGFALALGEQAIDISARGWEAHFTNQALRDRQSANKVLAIDLASRRDELERRLSEARNLQQLIRQQLGAR